MANDIVIESKEMNIKMDEFIHSANSVVKASEGAVVTAKDGMEVIGEVVERINIIKDKVAQPSYDGIIYE